MGYIRYQLEDNLELWVEAPGTNGAIIKSGLEEPAKKAQQSFDSALDGVKSSASILRRTFHDLEADETEVSFTLKTIGEIGVFAVGKLGAEANFQVTLKWKKASSGQQ